MVLLKKILKTLSLIILITALLSLFAAAVKDSITGGKTLGSFAQPFIYIAAFPSLVYEVLKSDEIRHIPPTYQQIDTTFKETNKINYSLYALNSFFIQEKDRWEIRLFDLKNDSVIHIWFITSDQISLVDRRFANTVPQNCILLANRSIIVPLVKTNYLLRLDKESNVTWQNNDFRYHHSANLSADSNIWICTSSAPGGFRINNKRIRTYTDNYITKIDSETGKTLFTKSLSEILVENGFPNFVYGCSNKNGANGNDPLHLNDIEPALSDGEYWIKDDLFISLRHKSLIIHYRPGINKIIHLIYGPFLNQHDVNIISDHEISILNNNLSLIGEHNPDTVEHVSNVHSLLCSEINIYNFRDSSFSSYAKDQFVSEDIFTATQGLHKVLHNGDVFVESQNSGKVYILNQKEVVLRKYFHTSIENMIERPHWIRIYEEINL